MPLIPFDFITCRTPAFAQDAQFAHKWEELKTLIKSSSPEFYQRIADLQPSQVQLAEEKLQFTVWKYFNRSRFRATPFGPFGSISVLPLVDQARPLILQEKPSLHEFTNWCEKDQAYRQQNRTLRPSSLLLANPTHYNADQEIRYLSFTGEGFTLSALTNFTALQTVLGACQHKTALTTLHSLLQKEHGLAPKDSTRLIRQLIRADLVISENFPNITGMDYFLRIAQHPPSKQPSYSIATREPLAGEFDRAKLHAVPELIAFIGQVNELPLLQDLEQFKIAFVKKFERAEIPLALAMDPEIGVGYGQLSTSMTNSSLIAELSKRQHTQHKLPARAHTDFHLFLMEAMIGGGVIHLENFSPEKKAKSKNLPNTFSVLFRQCKDHLVIEQMGGCTANALLGRFTLACEKTEQLARTISAFEQKSNPGVTFFDIAYQGEHTVDNVNRRKCFYPAELAINSWPTSPNPLSLQDMLVRVEQGEVRLRSKATGARLIPRLPSAYNYSRSDLSVYRMLCDLQHQNLQSDLSFDLKTHFPGLSHYPRVYYKQLIVSPESWLLPKTYAQMPNGSDPANLLSDLKKWLDDQSIASEFTAGQHDQTLLFNRHSDLDLLALLQLARSQKDSPIYLSEALSSPKHGYPRDQHGACYRAQFLASYQNDQQLYPPNDPIVPTVRAATEPKLPKLHLPGSLWLYLQVHCDPSRANQILFQQVPSLLRLHRLHIDQWFFIRYSDPTNHLRIRIKVYQQHQIGLLLQTVSNLFEPLLAQSLIQSLSIHTYVPEIHRYGPERMQMVERFFHLDSKLVLAELSKSSSDSERYGHALTFMSNILDSQYGSIHEKIQLTTRLAEQFARELSLDPPHFKKINSSFKELGPLSSSTGPGRGALRLLAQLTGSCQDARQKENLLADLIHMHINRLFSSSQRIHEAILYHYLLNGLRIKKAHLEH